MDWGIVRGWISQLRVPYPSRGSGQGKSYGASRRPWDWGSPRGEGGGRSPRRQRATRCCPSARSPRVLPPGPEARTGSWSRSRASPRLLREVPSNKASASAFFTISNGERSLLRSGQRSPLWKRKQRRERRRNKRKGSWWWVRGLNVVWTRRARFFHGWGKCVLHSPAPREV